MTRFSPKQPCPSLEDLEQTALIGQSHHRYATVIAHLKSCPTCSVVYSEIEALADLSEAALAEDTEPGFKLAAAGAGSEVAQLAWTSNDRQIVLRIEADATGKQRARLIGGVSGSVYYLPIVDEEPLRLVSGQSIPLPPGIRIPNQPTLIPDHVGSEDGASSSDSIHLTPLENET